MSDQTATITQELMLDQIAQTIRDEIAAVLRASEEVVTHALAAGDALIAAKKLVPPGDWMRWLAETLPDGKRASACRNYMRLAHHREYVDPTLSLTSNLLLVCGLEKREIGTPRHSPETKARVLAVAGEGHTMAEIARRTGVTKSTVHAWLDPAWAADKTARAREQQRDRRAQARGGEPESEELAEPDPRSRRYGEPGRAAIGRAVRRLAQVQGKDATREALLDLAAICRAWAERLGAPFDGPNEAEAA